MTVAIGAVHKDWNKKQLMVSWAALGEVLPAA